MTQPPYPWPRPDVTAAPGGRTPWAWVLAWCVAALPVGIGLAFYTLRLWTGAMSDCGDFDAGNRFAVAILYWPALSVVLWLALTFPVAVLARWSLAGGLLLGILVAFAICWVGLAGTGPALVERGFDAEACPAGLPDWWPGWAPR